jgi:hypothetical protein
MGRDADVVVVERGSVPGERSRTSWGSVRPQGRDPLEVPLAIEASRLFRFHVGRPPLASLAAARAGSAARSVL